MRSDLEPLLRYSSEHTDVLSFELTLVAQLLNGHFTPRNLSKLRGKTVLTILLNYLGYNKMEFQVFQNTELFLAVCVPLHLKGRNEIFLNSKCNGNDTFEEKSTHTISNRKRGTLRI